MTNALANPLGLFLLAAAPFMGSFVATFATRWPEGRSILTGRSACRSCAKRIDARDLVPVLSWLLLRGRCRHCHHPFGRGYLISELAAFGIALWAATAFSGLDLAMVCLLGWALLALALIDLRTMLLPDVLTLAVLSLGLAVAAMQGALAEGLAGAAVGFAVFALLAAGYRAWRGRDGLGMGDAKLLAAAGAWVGWSGLPGIVLMASVAALAVALPLALRSDGGVSREIAFGPYLAAAIWITVLYGPVTLA